MILSLNGIIAGKGTIPLDVDAQAFITAASITDSTQKSAINQLVLDLKTANIWTKMKALYPFVGGTASQHRFNLKDPRPVAGAFYLSYYGGGTHSANGYQPDGTTAYADTQLNPYTRLPDVNLNHLSFYSRTNSAVNSEYVMGASDGTGGFSMVARRDTNAQFFVSDTLGTFYRFAQNTSSTNGSGFFIGTQQGTNIKLFKNNTLAVSNSGASTGNHLPPFNVYIGTLNLSNNPSGFYTNKQCAFASIGEGLSDSEASALYNAVQTFQTTLGRQV